MATGIWEILPDECHRRPERAVQILLKYRIVDKIPASPILMRIHQRGFT
jgi:hypothetical protein